MQYSTTNYNRVAPLMGTAPNSIAIEAGGRGVQGLSPAEAFTAAGADYRVIERPVAVHTPDCWVPIPSSKALVREDNGHVLQVTTKSYTPVQNDRLQYLFEYLREDVVLDNIVVLRGGRRVFVSASIGVEGEVVAGDKVKRYIHAFNSFDGSSAFGVFFTDVRMFCTNQFRYISGKGSRQAAAEGRGLHMKHTSNVRQFAERLPELIDIQNKTFSQDLAKLRPLTTLKLTPEMAQHVLTETYKDRLAVPITDKTTKAKRPRVLTDLPELDTIRSHYKGNTGIAIDPSDRSVWNLFQAITQYETHDSGRAKDELTRARARLESLWGGAASTRIERAATACLALV